MNAWRTRIDATSNDDFASEVPCPADLDAPSDQLLDGQTIQRRFVESHRIHFEEFAPRLVLGTDFRMAGELPEPEPHEARRCSKRDQGKQEASGGGSVLHSHGARSPCTKG